jgi:hypothetical protein
MLHETLRLWALARPVHFHAAAELFATHAASTAGPHVLAGTGRAGLAGAVSGQTRLPSVEEALKIVRSAWSSARS